MQLSAFSIGDSTAKVLSAFASISRTLDTARFGLGAACEKADEAIDREKFAYCESEIELVQAAISDLHMSARTQIWRSNRGEYTSLEKFGIYCCLRSFRGKEDWQTLAWLKEHGNDSEFHGIYNRVFNPRG